MSVLLRSDELILEDNVNEIYKNISKKFGNKFLEFEIKPICKNK